jgi:hypothetical protein
MAHGRQNQPKRGFIVSVLTVPPLIYPFQYNPTQLAESKRIEWGSKYDADHPAGARCAEGLAAGIRADLAAFRTGVIPGLGKTLGTATEVLGRFFSAAEIKRFEKEQPATVSFKFEIDGRELRPGEPERRRNAAGDIVGDLAIIRSFAYPQVAGWLDMASALGGASAQGLQPAATWSNLWFNEPPTMTLVLGDRSFEGFVSDLRITETRFNAELDPTHAEVEITLIEKINSISFILGALKRIGRTAYFTDYEDIGEAVF